MLIAERRVNASNAVLLPMLGIMIRKMKVAGVLNDEDLKQMLSLSELEEESSGFDVAANKFRTNIGEGFRKAFSV
jgi:hypothetical protein